MVEEKLPRKSLIVAGAIVAALLVAMATIPLWTEAARDEGTRAAAAQGGYGAAVERVAGAVAQAAANMWHAARAVAGAWWSPE